MNAASAETLDQPRSVFETGSLPPNDEPAVPVGASDPEPWWDPPPPLARPRRKVPFAVSVISWALASICFLAVWTLVFAFVLSGWSEAGAQRRLYAQVREELAAQTGPIGGKIPTGHPVAVFGVPKLQIRKLVVAEGTSSAVLRTGPGHRRDTPLPGQPGTSVIMGRSLLYGAPFEWITELRAGDRISVTTGQGAFSYVVDGVRRAGDPVTRLERSVKARLTLITGTGRGHGVDRAAVFLDAHLVGKPQAAPKKRPSGVGPDELPMAGDPGALMLVVLYLELLVAVVVGVAWMAARWRVWPTVIVGIPLLFAALWLVTDTAAVLLPNLS